MRKLYFILWVLFYSLHANAFDSKLLTFEFEGETIASTIASALARSFGMLSTVIIASPPIPFVHDPSLHPGSAGQPVSRCPLMPCSQASLQP